MKNILLIAFLFSFTIVAQAQIYKWVDDNGNIQYTQTPPTDREVEVIRGDRTQGRPVTADFSLKQPGVGEEVEVKDVKDPDGEVTVIDTDKLEQYCAEQRHSLEVTERTKRISVMGDDGKISNISDAEKQKKIDNIKANLQKYCQ
jgi:hypothetical protein